MKSECIEVPLFPLNVVLFPGMALPLHIFEPCYRHMAANCLADHAPFGVVLARSEGNTTLDLPVRVGTLARISDYKQLPDGRYNLLAVGTRRFEIAEIRHEKPYATGLVRPLDDTPEPLAECETLACAARAALRDYLHLVTALVGSDERCIHIPDDAVELSFMIGMCLTCEDCEKQDLLEMTSVEQRLRSGTRILRDEIELLGEQFDSTRPYAPTHDRTSLN